MKHNSCVFAILILACGDQGTTIDSDFQHIELGIALRAIDSLTLAPGYRGYQILGDLDLSEFDSVSLNVVATDLTVQASEASVVEAWLRSPGGYFGNPVVWFILSDTLSAVPHTHSAISKDSEVGIPSPVDFCIGVERGTVHFSEITLRGWVK